MIDHDYVSEGFVVSDLAHAFPHRVLGDKQSHPWVFLRRDVPHHWYIDDREPHMGFLSPDEVSILETLARCVPDAVALEIGCHRGWSTAHLAANVKHLDVVDPVLANPAHLADIESSMERAGVRARCTFHAGSSPAAVLEIAARQERRWSVIFVDGDHEPDGPLVDARTVANLAAADAIIIFHDLASPVVAEGLAYMRSQGWSCLIFQTMQIMGVAWRGNVKIPIHIPDPTVTWVLPDHLRSFAVSGENAEATLRRLHRFLADFSSPYPEAQATAPLPMGKPTADALPGKISALRENILADLRGNILAERRVSDDLRRQLELRESLLEEVLRPMAEKDTRITSLFEQTTELFKEVASKEARITGLSGEAALKDARIAGLFGEAASMDARIAELSSEAASKDARIAELSSEAASKDARLTELSGEVASKEARIAKLSGEVASKEARIAELSGEVASKEARIAELSGEVASKAEQIQNHIGYIAAFDNILRSRWSLFKVFIKRGL